MVLGLYFGCCLLSVSLSDLMRALSLAIPCFNPTPPKQTPEELEDDSDFEQEDYDARSRTSIQTEDDQLIAGQSARVSTEVTWTAPDQLGYSISIYLNRG